jgi:hypothetical protein
VAHAHTQKQTESCLFVTTTLQNHCGCEDQEKQQRSLSLSFPPPLPRLEFAAHHHHPPPPPTHTHTHNPAVRFFFFLSSLFSVAETQRNNQNSTPNRASQITTHRLLSFTRQKPLKIRRHLTRHRRVADKAAKECAQHQRALHRGGSCGVVHCFSLLTGWW